MFVLKIIEITKLRDTFFVVEVIIRNKKGYSAEAVNQMYFGKKAVLKYLVKLTGKHFKKETPT